MVKNPKYKPNKKNNNTPPMFKDIRTLLIPIACGRCKECAKKKANNWRIRLYEDIKDQHIYGRAYFVTLTFNTESLQELSNLTNEIKNIYDKDNAIATIAVRRFLERWRKKYKKSIRHWLVTELGGEYSQHLHLHGIIYTKEDFENIRKYWKYGYVYPTKTTVKYNIVNKATINYIIKYCTKIDKKHIYYKPIILCSSGIGNNLDIRKKINKKEEKYITNEGFKLGLPTYYREKLYTEEEREANYIKKLDKGIRYINGIAVKNTEIERIKLLIKQAQHNSEEDGFLGDKYSYKQKEEEEKQIWLLRNKRLGNLK